MTGPFCFTELNYYTKAMSASSVKIWLAVNNLSLTVNHGLEASSYQVTNRDGSPVEWVRQGLKTPLSATIETPIKAPLVKLDSRPGEIRKNLPLQADWDAYETLREQLLNGSPAVKEGENVTPYLDIKGSLAHIAYKDPELLPYVQWAEKDLEATKHYTVQETPEALLIGCLLKAGKYERVTELLASKVIDSRALHSHALFWRVATVADSSKDPSDIKKLTSFIADPRNNEILLSSTAKNKTLGVEAAFELMAKAGDAKHPSEAGTLVGTYLKAIGLAPALVFQESNRLTRQSGFSLETKTGFLVKLGLTKKDTELVSKEPTDKYTKVLSNFPQTGFQAWGVTQAAADLGVNSLRKIYDDAVLTYTNTMPEKAPFIEPLR